MKTKISSKILLRLSLIPLMIVMSFGCIHSNRSMPELDLAETLMEDNPDSALIVVQNIDTAALNGIKEKARYALLKTMALDRNYVNITDLGVLQPALDYYPTTNMRKEIMRTYYYAAAIYMNRGDYAPAMQALVKARSIAGRVDDDSITLARTLVCQGLIYKKMYKFHEYIDNNRQAASIYIKINKRDNAVKALMRAHDGAIKLSKRELCDTLQQQMQTLGMGDKDIRFQLLAYAIDFGSKSDIIDAIHNYAGSELNDVDILELIYAYLEIGNPSAAYQVLADSFDNTIPADNLKYYALKSEALERIGRPEEALTAFKAYYALLDSMHTYAFFNDLQFEQDKHNLMEISIKKENEKQRILLISVFVVCVLLLLIVVGYILYRISRLKTVHERQRATLAETLLEKQSAENDALETKIQLLERECDDLRSVMDRMLKATPDKRSNDPITGIISQRIKKLDELLLGYIRGDKHNQEKYTEWIQQLTQDRARFMAETRQAYQEMHPRFIQHLLDHGLTEKEIGYVCLYAIGLSGKEIGHYTNSSGHYNMSSDIRKKLGIHNGTTFGKYIKELLKEG